MIHEEKCFCATCDNCGKTFESNHEGFTMFGTDDQLYQEMDNSEWYVGNDPDHENKYYCNECFKWHPDIDDKIILDATRTKQLDESPTSTDTAHTEEQLPVLTELEIENAVKELSKQSTAPDKETPDWMQSDIRRGIKWAIERLSNRYSKNDVFKILTKIQDAGLTITPHTRTWVKNYEKEINNIINGHTEELSREGDYVLRTINTDEYYWCKCENCGWEDSSEFCAGGHAIADSGDYSDPVCPVCCSNKIEGEPTVEVAENYKGIQHIKIPISVFLAPYKMVVNKYIELESKVYWDSIAVMEVKSAEELNNEMKNFNVRIKARIDRILRDLDIWSMLLQASEKWSDYTELRDKIYSSVGAIEPSDLLPSYPAMPTPHKEGYSVEGWVRVEDVEKLCRDAFVDADTLYKGININDWLLEFKLHHNL